MKEPLITPQAVDDLVEAWRYFAKGSQARADDFVEQIFKRCRLLAQFPGMGRLRENIAPNLRSFPVEKFVIFYRPVDETVQILRILYGGRDIESVFEREPLQEGPK